MAALMRPNQPARHRWWFRAARMPADDAPDQRLLTVAEACAVLRVSRWMVYRLIHARQLRTIKIGSRRLVPSAAVEEFLANLNESGDL